MMLGRLVGLGLVPLLLAGCGLSQLRAEAVALAAVEPLPLVNHWSPGLLGLPGYGATGLGPKGYPNVVEPEGELEPVQAFLASVGLQPADLPAGVALALVPRGDVLSQSSLDFCGAQYPSEPLRLVRREVAAGGNGLLLGSQMVQYESPEAAAQALAELRSARKACPTGTAFTDANGGSHRLSFHRVQPPAAVDLMPAERRVVFHFSDAGDLGEVRRLEVYQVRGNTLVAFYAESPGATAFSPTEQEVLFNLVSRLTGRLNAADPLDIGEFW